MKLADFYAYTEQTFDSFCKQVIRNECTDALRELAYHAQNETVFSALTPVEMARLSMVDRIPEDTVEFHIRGYTVTVENAALGQAIAVLPVRLRDVARQELESRTADMETEQQEYDKLKTWADLYDNCNFAAKKMIVSQFIKSVRVYRDYTLEVEFNVSFEQFQQLQAACSGGANERTNVCIEA